MDEMNTVEQVNEAPKTLEQRKTELNNRKIALEDKQKKVDEETKAGAKKKSLVFLIGGGGAFLGFTFMSVNFILGLIIAAAGLGVAAFLYKKNESLWKNNNDPKKELEEEAASIKAEEKAIIAAEEAERKRIEEEERARREAEEAERKRIEEEERKRKEEEERRRKEEELERQKAQIEAEEKGIYGSDCDFSDESLVDRKENLVEIEEFFDVDSKLSVEEKIDLINSAKESIKDLVTSTNINEMMEELVNTATVLGIDEDLSFVECVENIRTDLATIVKIEELLGTEIDNFDPNGKTLEQRVKRILNLEAKYKVDSTLSAEEQVSQIEAGVKAEEERARREAEEAERRRKEEEERRRRAEELKQKAVQIQEEIDAIYGVVESKFGFVSKLLLEGKMKKIEEFEAFFGVDSSLDVNSKIAAMQEACDKIKTLGINEPTIARCKNALIKRAKELEVSLDLSFDEMLAEVNAKG